MSLINIVISAIMSVVLYKMEAPFCARKAPVVSILEMMIWRNFLRGSVISPAKAPVTYLAIIHRGSIEIKPKPSYNWLAEMRK